MWCPGSGVVLDCIDFGSLPTSLLLLNGASLAIIYVHFKNEKTKALIRLLGLLLACNKTRFSQVKV